MLKKIGVDVKIDLPGVGENAQDHILCPTIYELDSSVEHDTIDRMKDLQYAASAKKLWCVFVCFCQLYARISMIVAVKGRGSLLSRCLPCRTFRYHLLSPRTMLPG